MKGVVVEVDYLTVVGETGNGSPFWMHYHFLFECIRMVFPQLAGFILFCFVLFCFVLFCFVLQRRTTFLILPFFLSPSPFTEFNLEKEILERMRASDDYAGLSPLQRTAAQYIRYKQIPFFFFIMSKIFDCMIYNPFCCIFFFTLFNILLVEFSEKHYEQLHYTPTITLPFPFLSKYPPLSQKKRGNKQKQKRIEKKRLKKKHIKYKQKKLHDFSSSTPPNHSFFSFMLIVSPSLTSLLLPSPL